METLFWGSVLVIGYVYAGYPLVLGVMVAIDTVLFLRFRKAGWL